MTQRWGALLAGVADAIDFFGNTAWPVVDILIRAWIAKQVLSSGVMMAADWTKAISMPASEVPVAWLGPQIAIVVGILLHTAGGISLLVGLGTRL
ncbi:MAG: hypothetical protein ACRETL_14390, partial [Gammaproteobacteria bacterium]